MPARDTEILSRAILEKAPAGALTPGQIKAKELREAVVDKGSRTTLEDLKARRPLDRRQGDQLLEANFGTDKDPATGRKIRAPWSLEEARFNSTEAEKTLLLKFVEGSPLTGLERTQFRSQLENMIRAWPPGEALFNTTGFNKDVALDEIMGNPRFAAEVKKLLGERLSGAPIEDKITQKKNELSELQSLEAQKTIELNATNNEYAVVRGNLLSYEMVAGVAGSKLVELTKLREEFPKLTLKLQEKQNDLDSAKDDLNSYKTRRDFMIMNGTNVSTIDQLITSKQGEIKLLRTEVTRLSNQVGRKQDLESEKALLEQKQKELEEKKSKLDQEKRDVERKRIATSADLASEKIDRETKEGEFSDSIKSIYSEASQKYLEDRITEYEIAQDERLAEEAAKAVDPAEKALIEQMKGKRWEKDKKIGVGRFGRRIIKVLDGKAIQADFNTVMTANGDPKEAMKNALIAGGLTPVEADAKVNDLKFMEKMAPQFMEKLLTRAVECGVKFTEHDARVIIESQWGEDMINKAINNSDALKKALEKLGDKGVLEGGLRQWIKEKSGGSLLKFLLLLLTGGILLSGVTAAGGAAIFK